MDTRENEIMNNMVSDAAARAEFMEMISGLTQAEKIEVLEFIRRRFASQKKTG